MKSTYIIGEIGQNHNGSVDIAKLLIDLAVRPVIDELYHRELKPIDAIKLTKRDLNEELSASQYNEPYNSLHSFGKTYGEHREALELSDEEHAELFRYTKEKGADFIETLCAPGTLSILKLFTPDKLKVASRDLTNLPLLHALGETKIPIILSTGMAGKAELNNAIDVVDKYHSNISILHCISQYPTEYSNVNLRTIAYLLEKYPNYKIGFSDHTIGIIVSTVAVAMGAEIIEKHITIDRRMKGSDQAGSLGPDGISRMVRDIRNLELALGEKDLFVDPSTKGAKNKLERSIATKVELPIGHIIAEDDVHLLSPGDGYKWSEKEQVIGRRVVCQIAANEIIYSSNIE